MDINLDISTNTSPQVWSTGYGGFVYTQGNTVHSSLGSYYKNGATQPAEGFEWRGNGKPGSKQGSWHNPSTGESLHSDLDHPPPVKPHWDYEGPNGEKARLNNDGTWEWKR